MHIVIIWQQNDEIRGVLQPLLTLGAGGAITPIQGHHVLLHEVKPDYPKGANVDAIDIFTTIMAAANDALQKAPRAAELRVFFIFHQTSRETVNGIMRALQMLGADVLDALALAAGKNLTVGNVILQSCESATDKNLPDPMPDPVPPALAPLVPWADQARNMRAAALKAFTVGPSVPIVITFSTGNPVTGALSLNPFAAEFRALRGQFRPDGTWEYDPDPNSPPDRPRPDHTQTPCAGTLYADNGQPGGATTQPVPAGGQLNLMPFSLP